MTTIVIHGTYANKARWALDSWGQGGFLQGLCDGMTAADGADDIWRVNGRDMSEIDQLSEFHWSGSNIGSMRGEAGDSLARYLNQLADLTDEPVNVVAHSHGCNVVKYATSSRHLGHHVYLDNLVFLACPHFHEPTYSAAPARGLEKFTAKAMFGALEQTGAYFAYRINPDRVGRILNLYSERDAVQTTVAQTVSGTTRPLPGGFFENIAHMGKRGQAEMPVATRQDLDPDAQHLYDDCHVVLSGGGKDRHAHGAMHGNDVGFLAGFWMSSGMDIETALDHVNGLTFDIHDHGG